MGQPVKVGRDGTREQVIERYKRWLRTQSELLAYVHELAGKTLGCWCAPRACHGNVLARLADEHERDSESVDDGDPLCACAHRRSSHAPPASGDTRCLVVEDRRDLLAVFDDGREDELAYCACQPIDRPLPVTQCSLLEARLRLGRGRRPAAAWLARLADRCYTGQHAPSSSAPLGRVVAIELTGAPSVDYFEFQSYNFPDHFIRHRNFQGELTTEAVGQGDDFLFRLVGRGSGLVSLGSLNFPRRYLRYRDFRIWLEEPAGQSDQLFKQDSTFFLEEGLADPNGLSFRSLNFPDRYLRHRTSISGSSQRTARTWHPTQRFTSPYASTESRQLSHFAPVTVE